MRDGLKFSYKMAALKEKETTVLKKTLILTTGFLTPSACPSFPQPVPPRGFLIQGFTKATCCQQFMNTNNVIYIPLI